MIIFNLEVVDGDGCFEDLVLDLFNNNIFTVDQNQNITGTESYRIRPTPYGGIEGMARGGDDLLTVDKHVDQFIGLIDVGFNNFF